MLRSILDKLGLGGGRRTATSTIRLEIVAEQVREFGRGKRLLSEKVGSLETKTGELDSALSRTLQITRQNQDRLGSIEESLKQAIALSERIIAEKPKARSGDLGAGDA